MAAWRLRVPPPVATPFQCWNLLRGTSCSSGRSFSTAPPPPSAPNAPMPSPGSAASSPTGAGETKLYRQRLLDGTEEVLTEEQKREKDEIIKDLTRRLSGPLADEHGNVPTGKDRPIAIEVDGPSHFYANSKRYTAYTKLKHRLLTRMGYKVLHVPYFEWRRLRGAKEREDYMRLKLQEEPTEWLDPEDEKYYEQLAEEGGDLDTPPKPQAPPTPPAPGPAASGPSSRRGPPASQQGQSSWPATPQPPRPQATSPAAPSKPTAASPPGPPPPPPGMAHFPPRK